MFAGKVPITRCFHGSGGWLAQSQQPHGMCPGCKCVKWYVCLHVSVSGRVGSVCKPEDERQRDFTPIMALSSLANIPTCSITYKSSPKGPGYTAQFSTYTHMENDKQCSADLIKSLCKNQPWTHALPMTYGLWPWVIHTDVSSAECLNHKRVKYMEGKHCNPI